MTRMREIFERGRSEPPERLAPLIAWTKRHPVLAVLIMSSTSTAFAILMDRLVRRLTGPGD